MNLVFLGSGEFGIDTLNTLARSPHELKFIVTQPPKPAGRGAKLRPTPVARWARDHSVPCLESSTVNAPDVVDKIARYEPDLLLVIAFGQKIGPDLINLPPKVPINVHASLLPKYRGAAPINWAIVNGETKTGISIITLADKMDAGKILAQSETDIGPDENAGQLHDRLARMAPALLTDTLEKIEAGAAVYTEQDHSKATLAPRLKKSDGFLNFNQPAESLRRRILGLWPWPGASATYRSAETGKYIYVTIAMAERIQNANPAALQPGTLDQNLNVICAENALKITEIKPQGSRLMNFRDFANGRHARPGDIFTNPESPKV